MKAPGIYQILHVDSGRVYVGSAVNIAQRWAAHRSCLQRGSHRNNRLQAAWFRFGPAAFTFSVLELLPDGPYILAELIPFEQIWIDALSAVHPRRGFNACRIAGSNLGMKLSAETRAKMSAAQLGRKPSSETCAKIALASKANWPQASARLQEHNIGRIFSAETRAKIGAANKNPSAETRVKCGAANVGRHPSAEVRAKQSAAAKGRIRSPEAIAKQIVALTGKKHSPETIAKLSLIAQSRSPELKAKMISARALSMAQKRIALPAVPGQLALELSS